jgi:hypothetical protein
MPPRRAAAVARCGLFNGMLLDGLPAHKTKLVKTCVTSTEGRLTLHFLPDYAPGLNPDELV